MNCTVKDLGDDFTTLAGQAGLKRVIESAHVVTPDFTEPAPERGAEANVVHLRPSQIAYLCSRPPAERLRLVRALLEQRPACIFLTGRTVCKELLEKAEASKIPVLKTGSLRKVIRLLAEKVTPRINCHGVLVQIFGMGTLIIGESGVGKSEVALDLVLHGHKLIADDVVVLENSDQRISGRPLELGADHIHIRGLGIINVRALYGDSAVAASCGVGLVVELENHRKERHYNLTGLREQRYRLLGVNLPYLRLPVRAGQNTATLIEVAARNQSLKQRGIFAARDFNRRLKKRLVR